MEDGAGPCRTCQAVGSLDFILGWVRGHKKYKDFCKLRRAECASPQQLPDGDAQTGASWFKDRGE